MPNAQPLAPAPTQTKIKTKTDISQALLIGLMVLTTTLVLGVFSGMAAIALERLYAGQGIKYEAYNFGTMGEYGVIYNLDYASNKYHRIYTKNNYSSPWPVIIAKPLSYLDSQPAHVRIVGMGYDSIKKKNFIDLKLEEWAYLDKFHTKETVSILILKQGVYQDTNLGFQMKVGTASNVTSWAKGGTAKWTTVNFGMTFSQVPVILSQTQFYVEGDEPVTTRHYTVAKDKFVLRLQEEEAKGDHTGSTVGYVAISPINTTMTGKGNFKIDANNNYSVNNQFKTVAFRQNFGEQPIFFADIQSFKDWDTADLRYQNLYNDSVQVKVEEEQSSDTETTHAYETVGYVALQRSTPIYCGNGIIETGEDCDDGGNVNADGCSAVCTNELSLSLIPNLIHAKQYFTAQINTGLKTGVVKVCDDKGYVVIDNNNTGACIGDTICTINLAQTNSCLITGEDLDTNMNGYTYWAGLGKGKASDTILVDECIGVGGTPFGDLCYLELGGYDSSFHTGGTIAVIAQYYKQFTGYQEIDYFQANYDPPITPQYDLNSDGLISAQEYLLFDLSNFPGSLKDYRVINYNGRPLLARYIVEPSSDGSRVIKTSVLWLVSNNSERIVYVHNSISNFYEPGVTTTVTMEEQLARAFSPTGFLTQYLEYYPNILTFDPPQCGNDIVELDSEQCESDSDCPANNSCSGCNCATPSTLSVNPTSLDVGYATSTASFLVENTGGGTLNWSAAESCDWLTLSPVSGSVAGGSSQAVNVSYLGNSTANPRSCNISVTAAGVAGSSAQVTVNQEALPPRLGLNTHFIAVFPQAGTSYNIEVHNTGGGTINWSAAESCDWLSLSTTSGISDGYFQVLYDSNPSTDDRTCEITVTADGVINSPQIVTFQQAGKSAITQLILANQNVDYSTGSTNLTFSVSRTPVNWAAQADCSWATLSQTSGFTSNTNNTLSVNYDANGQPEARSCSISVYLEGDTATGQSVTLSQVGKP